MIKSAAGKVMWVGRATVFLVGLAVILALVFGAVSTVSAHTADKGFFHLGHKNVAKTVSTLVKKGVGPALSLKVGSGPPLAVNSGVKVANLNSDRLDNLNSSAFLRRGQKAADSDKLDGLHESAFLRKAGTAADSDKLDGLDSSAFARPAQIARAKGGSRSGGIPLSGTSKEVASVTVTFPANGYALFYMESEFKAREAGTWINGSLMADTVLYSWWWDPGDVDGFYDQTQPRSHFMPVSEGTHTYKMYLNEQSVDSAYSDAHQAQVNVMYFSASL